MREIPRMQDLMDLCERVDAFKWRDEVRMQLYSGKEPDWPRVLEKILLPQVDA